MFWNYIFNYIKDILKIKDTNLAYWQIEFRDDMILPVHIQFDYKGYVRTCSVVRRQWRTGGLLVVGKVIARPFALTGPRTARERPDDPPLIPSLDPERALRPYYAYQGFCNHQKAPLSFRCTLRIPHLNI